MENRKVQLYLTEAQYRYLKQRAGTRGSIAGVVRELIDSAGQPSDPERDPFYGHLLADKPGSGGEYDAETAKRDLYRSPG
jgi:hypothetical protein